MLRLAWRNLWRNARRTMFTLAAVSLGSAAIIGVNSYRESAFAAIMRSVTGQLVGNLQVHGRGYQESPEISNVVADPVAVEATLSRALPGVRSERRILGAGLGGSGDSSSGVVINGIEPGSSSMLLLKSGRDLAAQPAKEAVVGVELAEQLDLKVGGELVLVGQDAHGAVANDRFTVVGIGDAGSSDLNSTAVFLHLRDAQEFFGLGEGVHQLVLHLPSDEEDVSAPLSAARAALDLRALEALSWNEMLPELRGTVQQKRQGQRGIDFILFLIVGLGVLNSMTMSTFERTREFGVMLALGTRPGRLIRLVVTEALLQGLLGLAAGVLMAGLLIAALGTLHIAGAGQGDFAGVRMPESIHLKLSPQAISSAASTVVATLVAAGFIPAFRASRLRAADALREA